MFASTLTRGHGFNWNRLPFWPRAWTACGLLKTPDRVGGVLLLSFVIFSLLLFAGPFAFWESMNANHICPYMNDTSEALGELEYKNALLVSFAILFPMTLDVFLDSFGEEELRHGRKTRYLMIALHLLSEAVCLFYITRSRNVQVYFSLALFREVGLIAVVMDFMQRYGSEFWAPETSIAIVVLTGIARISSLHSQTVGGNFETREGVITFLVNLLPILIQSHFFAKFCVNIYRKTKSRMAKLSANDFSCLTYSCALLFWTFQLLFFFMLFRPKSICDLSPSYLIAKTYTWTTFSFLVSFLHGRRLQQEASDTNQSLQMKRMFVRYVSHEIRTPLNILQTGISLILHMKQSLGDLPDSDTNIDPAKGTAAIQSPSINGLTLDKAVLTIREIFSMADEMKESCTIAVNILNDLLLYEKLEGGILVLEKSKHPARLIVEETADAFAIQAREKDIELRCTCNEELKCLNPEDEVLIEVDKPKIAQVIRNLVSNAIKFSSRGSVVTVHTTLRGYRLQAMEHQHQGTAKESPDAHRSLQCPVAPRAGSGSGSGNGSGNGSGSGGHSGSGSRTNVRKISTSVRNEPIKRFVRIEVTDSGAGISPENQAKLFKQIIQFSPNELQGGGGSGLGLYISKGIVAMHGGRIGVFSPGEGCGSRFYIELPVAESLTPMSTMPASQISQKPMPPSVRNDRGTDVCPKSTENENARGQGRKSSTSFSFRGDLVRGTFSSSSLHPLNRVRSGIGAAAVAAVGGGSRGGDKRRIYAADVEIGADEQDAAKTVHFLSRSESQFSGVFHSLNRSQSSISDSSPAGMESLLKEAKAMNDALPGAMTVDSSVSTQTRMRQAQAGLELALNSEDFFPPIIDVERGDTTNMDRRGEATVPESRDGEMSLRAAPSDAVSDTQKQDTDTQTVSLALKDLCSSNGALTTEQTQGSQGAAGSTVLSVAVALAPNPLPLPFNRPVTVPTAASSGRLDLGLSKLLSGRLSNPRVSQTKNNYVHSNSGGMSRQRRVLIVDDSPTNRKMLVRLLRMHNICAAPMEAEDGLQAVKMVSAAMLAKLVDAAGSSYCLEGSSRHNSGNPSCLTSASASPSAAPSGSTSAVASPPASADSSTHFLQPRTSQQLLLPDVILMDFIMPNLDGPSATEQLRQKIGYDGLIIGVTGNALSDEIDYFLRMGADRVLTKPINVDELREIIESSS